MLAIAVIGGTLAYFTDTDADINVMTAGNVKIQQDEWQTNDDGIGYEEYENNRPLFPYTGPTNDDGIATEYNSTLYYPKGEINNPLSVSGNAFANANNAIDKIVTVANNGTLPAYIRTLFAFELSSDKTENVNPAKDGEDMLNYVMFNDGTCFNWTDVTITVDGVKYIVAEYYYNFNTVDDNKSAINPGYYSYPSLLQVYVGSDVDNEWYDMYGDKYNILVISQATQMAGFEDAKTALDTAFAPIVDDNTEEIQGWFDSIAGTDGIGVDSIHPSAVEGGVTTKGPEPEV